ncbi:diguanylate cyclase domain-containing protein [Ectothiorhodospira marina]|uniref:diguanylate cyclase domain-containing protein n=1 Tax=Ectothiorhodospira marina TaxID=1396821 RepID=UPI000B7F299C|nr:diguanylate cyclase [Ectothiorhodospira marina]
MGHDSGDIVLQVVAARLGGDEFALLLADDKGQWHPDPRRLARRAEEQLSLPIQVKGRLVKVGCSVGVATAVPGDKPQDLLNRADEAMYQVKGAQRKGR